MKTLKSYPSYKDSENPFLKMIPSTWKKSKLKKHFKITSSKRVFENDWKSEGIPFYRARDISHLNNPNYLPDIFISREHYLRNISIHGPINIGDIIVTAVGTLGEVLVIREDKKFYFKDGNIIWFKTLNNIESDYVRLLFKTPIIKEQIKYNSNTTTVGTLTIENAKNFEIPLPSIQEQQKIIDFLNQKTLEIDSLISDKEKLIALLEEKRQAIITEAVTKGLDPEVKMKDSGVKWIGEIPEHWKISKVKYVSNINKHALLESTEPDFHFNYIDISSVNSSGEIIKVEELSFRDAPSRARRILNQGDTLVSTVRTYLQAITWLEEADNNFIGSTGFAVLTPRKDIEPKYLSYLTRSSIYIDTIVSMSNGVSYPATNSKDIGDLSFIYPPHKEQKSIVNYIDSKTDNIINLKKLIRNQVQKLKEYRQSFIYEAVTGKIDVQEILKETEQEEVSSS